MMLRQRVEPEARFRSGTSRPRSCAWATMQHSDGAGASLRNATRSRWRRPRDRGDCFDARARSRRATRMASRRSPASAIPNERDPARAGGLPHRADECFGCVRHRVARSNTSSGNHVVSGLKPDHPRTGSRRQDAYPEPIRPTPGANPATRAIPYPLRGSFGLARALCHCAMTSKEADSRLSLAISPLTLVPLKGPPP
jgi:hypothetical protein